MSSIPSDPSARPTSAVNRWVQGELSAGLLRGWVQMPGITITNAVEMVAARWAADAVLTEQSTAKFTELAFRFGAFCAAHDVTLLDDVDEARVRAFIKARGHDRTGRVVPPAVATMQNRRAVLRAFYRTARALTLTYADPARDIALPDRAPSTTRALTATEADFLWFHAWDGGRDSRHAATVALLLAGVQTGEAAHITIADLDLERSRVYAHGSSKHVPRWLSVDATALDALCTRAQRSLDRFPEVAAAEIRLATDGTGSDAQLQSRIGMAVREVLRQAGLGDDPGLRPSSVTAYAGVRAFDASRRIEDAARVLGLTSLDAAARAIGFEWGNA